MEKPVAVNRCLAITMQSIFQKTNAPNAPIVLNNLGIIFPNCPPVSRLAGFLFLFKSCRPSSLGRCPERTGRDPRALDRSTPFPVRRPLSMVRVPSGVVRCSGSCNNSPPFLVRGSRKIFKSFCLLVCPVRIRNREKRQRILTISGQNSWKICRKSRFFGRGGCFASREQGPCF